MARNGSRSLGAAFIVLVLLLVIVVVVGIWRGWWRFGAEADKDKDTVEFKAQVDRERIGEDVGAVAESAREAAQNVGVAADLETVRGTVTDVRPASEELVIESETESLTFKTSDATEFVVGEGAASLDTLQAGQNVLVTYRQQEDANSAIKIEVTD